MKFYALNSSIFNKNKHFFKKLRIKKFNTVVTKDDVLVGWGRETSGNKAVSLSKKKGCKYLLCEDGFYRSVKTGDYNHLSISIIKDDIGIYYDSNNPSKLENILNNDKSFLSLNNEKINQNIEYIISKQLSKYNFNLKVPDNLFQKKKKKKRLIFASQTADDISLEYGFGNEFSDIEIIVDILKFYPASDYDYFLIIHPETLSGHKKSDLDVENFKSYGFEILSENYNPIDLISKFDVVCTKTSQIGFEALLLKKVVVCYGVPFYSGWGLTVDKISLQRRNKKRTLQELFYASVIMYTEYRNPINDKEILLEEALQLLNYFKIIFEDSDKSVHLYGFPILKRNFVSSFMRNKNIVFHQYKPTKNILKNEVIYVWGMKGVKNIPLNANNNKNIVRVEDGFIRSVNIGSNLSTPLSLIFDRTGIYFNSEGPSDLENLLNDDLNFNDSIREQGNRLISILNKTVISKYNNNSFRDIKINTDKKIILVVGQVDGEASLKFNCNKGLNNLDFLKQVRIENPSDYIIYNPHPDVVVRNRTSSFSIIDGEKYYDEIIIDSHIDSVIKISDEIHVMTSLTGLEALIRGKKVVCYGTPFYSGWGLTTDKFIVSRRNKKRSLPELVAATYILYPRYIDIDTKSFTDVFSTIDKISKPLVEEGNRQIRIKNNGIFEKIYRIFINLFKGLK